MRKQNIRITKNISKNRSLDKKKTKHKNCTSDEKTNKVRHSIKHRTTVESKELGGVIMSPPDDA